MRLPSFEEPTTGRVGPALFIVSPADPWIGRLQEAESLRDRVVLATACLRKDPGCIDAHLELAACTDNADRRLRHLRKAVETGERLWNPVAAEFEVEMTWWGFAGTRPYMRAIHALGNALLESGAENEARTCYDRLLTMNPNDNQGIRYVVEALEAEVPGMRI